MVLGGGGRGAVAEITGGDGHAARVGSMMTNRLATAGAVARQPSTNGHAKARGAPLGTAFSHRGKPEENDPENLHNRIQSCSEILASIACGRRRRACLTPTLVTGIIKLANGKSRNIPNEPEVVRSALPSLEEFQT